MAKKTWIAQTVSEDEVADTLNELEAGEGKFELHSVQATGQTVPGSGGFKDQRPTYLLIGSREPKREARVGS